MTVTPRKLPKMRIAESAGMIISAEISSAPISRIPSTTVTAVSTDISAFISPVRVPDAFANVSSKVTAKTRL